MDGSRKRLIRLIAHSEFVQEHTLEGEELGLLCGCKEHEIRIVNDIESLREFMWIVVVTACLFTKLQESLLDLNIWQQIDFGERADAHVL